MSTLREAIEKVGVGGKVSQGNGKPETVLGVGVLCALLAPAGSNHEWAAILDKEGWSPVIPKKRVVLQAWENKDSGAIFFSEHGVSPNVFNSARRKDLPDLITEDGKWVLNADA